MDVGRMSVVIIVANLPLYVLWGWVLFRSWENFWDAVRFLFKPELWSLIDGEYWDDIIAEAKLALWFVVPLLLTRLELWLFLGL